MYDLAAHWNEILLYIKDEYDIDQLPFDTFLRPLSLYTATESEVTIAAPISLNAIGLNYLNKTY